MLLSGRHTAPVAYFEESTEAISETLAGVLRDADALGLPYPYDALRMVEVPARLRGYGGGWQMDTTLALPGMLLLRERGFPTAYFGATRLSTDAPPATKKLDLLTSFFREDRHGAGPFAGLARSTAKTCPACSGCDTGPGTIRPSRRATRSACPDLRL